MSEKVTWGYTDRGDRAHQLAEEPPRAPESQCCSPSRQHAGRCCVLGFGLCGALLIDEISEKKMPFWLECRRCARLKHHEQENHVVKWWPHAGHLAL